ncbi:catalase [Clostridium sp. ATCC 25772]|uniref:catalase n=1 Tax=Clostridium sp. ATCC 25772 TaxID=1676991 RepID=UPI000AD325F0|nr:catalase [Clostridium sp. ATCC 25772]
MKEKKIECDKYMTTNQGAPIYNDSNSLTVGDRGPTLLQDIQLIEKLSNFNRERIPERVVHAKGAGAYGVFKVHNCMKKYTEAKFLQGQGTETATFVRFSTVIGSKGSADTLRDPRGFAVKFYTEDGNYDLVGNHIPVFFIRDAMKFPDMVHSFKPSPDTNLHDPNRFWDFITNSPESTHMITWLFSDRGTIKSYRKIEGFGVNTYVWVNNQGERHFVKYHWKPLAGLETITRDESMILAGTDPDIATRDLYDTLNNGKTIEYDLFVQLMKEHEELDNDFDPLDATKVWPERLYPLIKVGRLTLNRAPKDFFTEVEQAAFCPANLIPGIEASNDKLLQGRLFAYHDSQRYRIGKNFEQLQVNKPKVQVNNNIEDGAMNYHIREGKVNYKPNSLNDNRPIENKEQNKNMVFIEGKIQRNNIPITDDFSQAGDRYRAFSKIEQDHLVDNLIDDLLKVDKFIQKKAVINFMKSDKELGIRVKDGLKL